MSRTRTWSTVTVLAAGVACAALVVAALTAGDLPPVPTAVFVGATFAAGWAWVLRTPGLYYWSLDRVKLNEPHWIGYARACGWLLAAETAVALVATVPAVALDGAGWRWLFISLVGVPVGAAFMMLMVPLSVIFVVSPVRLLVTRMRPALRGDRSSQVAVLLAVAVLAFISQEVLLAIGDGHDPARGSSSTGSDSLRDVGILLGLDDPGFGALPWALWAARACTVTTLLCLGLAAVIGARRLATPPGTGTRKAVR